MGFWVVKERAAKLSTCWSRSNDLWVMSPTRFLCAKVLGRRAQAGRSNTHTHTHFHISYAKRTRHTRTWVAAQTTHSVHMLRDAETSVRAGELVNHRFLLIVMRCDCVTSLPLSAHQRGHIAAQ